MKTGVGWLLGGVVLAEVWLAGLWLAPMGMAQGIQVGGPVTGLLYDPPTRSLRQILGMVGAARLSDAVMSDVDWASVAPNGRTALVARQGEVQWVVVGADVTATAVSGVAEAPQMAQWSADSGSVAVYLPESRSVQWIRAGVEPYPAIALPVEAGRITAMAAGNGLAALALEGAGVGLLRQSGEFVMMSDAGDVAALVLAPDGQTLWVANRATAEVIEIAILPDGMRSETAIRDGDRLSGISAMGLSSDASMLYVADGPTGRLYSFRRATCELDEGLILDAQATLVAPAGRASLFLLGLRRETGTPVFLLDESNGLRVLFVPAPDGGGL